MFDFGAGGAHWISAQDRDWLIDTGPAQSHDSILLPFTREVALSRRLTSRDGDGTLARPESSCAPAPRIVL